MCSDIARLLHGDLAQSVDCTWLEAQLTRMADLPITESGQALAGAYTAVARRFGNQPLPLSPQTQVELRAAELGSVVWTAKALARAVLLLDFTNRVDEAERMVRDLFYKGDSDERVVVLRCLSLLPDASQYELVATDAVRSHVQGVFEAIACENPYPSRFFGDLAFNQLVMKAYFTLVPVNRIVGLEQRRNPELTRMALDFAAERRAASRSLPPDLHLVTG
jgi:hypothetical protein